jgi:hypothetical protein
MGRSKRKVEIPNFGKSDAGGDDMPQWNAEASRCTVTIDTCPDAVDTIISMTEIVNNAQAEIKTHRKILDLVTDSARIEAEKDQKFAKTVYATGKNGTLTFTFPNTFASVDVAKEADIRQVLGDEVTDHLFEKGKKVTVRTEKMDALAALLGDRAVEFLQTTEYLAPVKEFRERRFEMRPLLTDEENVKLDAVAKAFSQSPAMKTK